MKVIIAARHASLVVENGKPKYVQVHPKPGSPNVVSLCQNAKIRLQGMYGVGQVIALDTVEEKARLAKVFLKCVN